MLQPENTSTPINSTESGIVTSSRLLQFEKALLSIILTPSGIITFLSDMQSANA